MPVRKDERSTERRQKIDKIYVRLPRAEHRAYVAEERLRNLSGISEITGSHQLANQRSVKMITLIDIPQHGYAAKNRSTFEASIKASATLKLPL